MTMTYTHFRKLDNPDYIGAYAFQPNEKKTLTISKVSREVITGKEGKKEECTIVRWHENEKPLILNATNGKMISKIVGSPYIEEWVDKRVVLGVEKVKAFGEVLDAVRVKNEKPKQSQSTEPPPDYFCADCNEMIADSGGFTMSKIVAAGMKRYGVVVCLDCANKRAAASKQDNESEGVTEDEIDQNQNQ
jgi:hypothetical protein